MKYFLGVQNDSVFDRLTYANHKKILFSHHYFNSKARVKKVLEKNMDHDIMVDSGAFTAWSTGKPVSLEEVRDFYKFCQDIKPDLLFINLDQIPGKRGRKPTKEQAEEACKVSWHNYQSLKKDIHNLLPVFHEDDDFKYLEMMKKETNFIAISPANDSSTKRRMQWLDVVYSNLKADYKTHGLAATSVPIMQRYPFYSVDSVNYRAFAMYGRGESHSREMLLSKRKNSNSQTHYVERVIQDEIKAYQKIEADITRLWKGRGVEW